MPARKSAHVWQSRPRGNSAARLSVGAVQPIAGKRRRRFAARAKMSTLTPILGGWSSPTRGFKVGLRTSCSKHVARALANKILRNGPRGAFGGPISSRARRRASADSVLAPRALGHKRGLEGACRLRLARRQRHSRRGVDAAQHAPATLLELVGELRRNLLDDAAGGRICPPTKPELRADCHSSRRRSYSDRRAGRQRHAGQGRNGDRPESEEPRSEPW